MKTSAELTALPEQEWKAYLCRKICKRLDIKPQDIRIDYDKVWTQEIVVIRFSNTIAFVWFPFGDADDEYEFGIYHAIDIGSTVKERDEHCKSLIREEKERINLVKRVKELEAENMFLRANIMSGVLPSPLADAILPHVELQ